MRGAGQRQFPVAEAVGSAAPLSTSGSAWIALTAERGNTGRIDIADRQHRLAVRVEHGDRAAMTAFDDAAAQTSTRTGFVMIGSLPRFSC